MTCQCRVINCTKRPTVMAVTGETVCVCGMGDETSLPSAQFSWDHKTALKILFVYKKERKKTVWGAHYLFLLGKRDKLGQEVGWDWGSGVLEVRVAWGLSGWVWTGDPMGRCRWGPHGRV